jgi:hypothetical protein
VSGRSKQLTYAVNGYRCIDCPVCPEGTRQAVRVDRHGGSLSFKPYCGHDEAAVAAKVDTQAILTELIVASNGGDREGGSPPESAADKLSVLLGLDVVGGRVVGPGSTASADLRLAGGAVVTFDSLRDICNRTRLAQELVAQTGVVRMFTAREALEVASLVREVGEHVQTATKDSIAVDRGVTFLQEVELFPDFDYESQAERWGMWSEQIGPRSPLTTARAGGKPVAKAIVVPRHLDGTRFVRSSWFTDYWRSQDPAWSAREIIPQMLRVGWTRPGGEGLIKATQPPDWRRPPSDGRRQLSWAFYVVPPGWEERDA